MYHFHIGCLCSGNLISLLFKRWNCDGNIKWSPQQKKKMIKFMLLVRVYLGKGPCQVTKILKSNEKRICKSKQTVVQTLDSREKTLLERAKNTKTKTNSNTMTLGKWVKNPQQKYDRRDHSPPLKRSKMRFIGLLQQLSMA